MFYFIDPNVNFCAMILSVSLKPFPNYSYLRLLQTICGLYLKK